MHELRDLFTTLYYVFLFSFLPTSLAVTQQALQLCCYISSWQKVLPSVLLFSLQARQLYTAVTVKHTSGTRHSDTLTLYTFTYMGGGAWMEKAKDSVWTFSSDFFGNWYYPIGQWQRRKAMHENSSDEDDDDGSCLSRPSWSKRMGRGVTTTNWNETLGESSTQKMG